MPKMKTNRAAAKRFRFTKRGKVKAKRAYLRHILTSKAKKQKRRLRSSKLISAGDMKQVRRLLPYGLKKR
jgi:large subunit ribosomal protein L35